MVGSLKEIESTWTTQLRVDITFSLASDYKVELALRKALKVIEDHGNGWTVRKGQGGWQGERESSRTITQVGVEVYSRTVSDTAQALFDAGCEAIQVESYEPEYRCSEWKRA